MQHRSNFPAVSVLFGNPGKYNIQLSMNLQINTNMGLEQPLRMPQHYQFGQPAVQYGGHYMQRYYPVPDHNGYAPNGALGPLEDSFSSLASAPGSISNSWSYHNARKGCPYSSTPIPKSTTGMSSYTSSHSNHNNAGCFSTRKCNII